MDFDRRHVFLLYLVLFVFIGRLVTQFLLGVVSGVDNGQDVPGTGTVIGSNGNDASSLFASFAHWISRNWITLLIITIGTYCLNKWKLQKRFEEQQQREFIPRTPQEIEREKRHEESRRRNVEEKQKEFAEKSAEYHQSVKDWKIKKLDQKLKDIEFLNTYEEKPSDARIHRAPPNVIQPQGSVSAFTVNLPPSPQTQPQPSTSRSCRLSSLDDLD